MTVIAFSSAIGPVPINCVITEKHVSSVEITANPIETGAEVNDHAYIKPKQVTLDLADGKAAETYNALMRFQATRVPFVLVTGLAMYKNMLIQDIDATRDAATSRILRASVTLREVIIVSTGSAPAGEESSKGKPGGKDSLTSSNPKKDTVTDGATADKVSSVSETGDNTTTTVGDGKTKSLLSRLF